MKQTWRIWLLYALCLAVVLPAMGWLTHRALLLDAAEAAARARADQEENLGAALWRIDAELTPLLATEAARPYFVYRSFFPSPASKTTNPSPLLESPSSFVLLHFELSSREQWTSPQCPDETWSEVAAQVGTTFEDRAASRELLDRLASEIRFTELEGRLPRQMLASSAIVALDSSDDGAQQLVQNSVAVQQQANAAPEQAPAQQAFAVGFDQERRSQSRRAYNELNRDVNLQNATKRQVIENTRNYGAASWGDAAVGVTQPLWTGTHLLLARRVTRDGETYIQGCWLDWPRIRKHLQNEVAAIAPRLELMPVKEEIPAPKFRPGRLLATLPVMAEMPLPATAPAALSPVRVSLMIAWFCLLAVLAAVGILLWKVVALSERRATFVSAVTHELRTPLTTFRLYSELLAGGMAKDEAQRQTYYETLRVEADRLFHLVENVLAYARLERGRAGRSREAISAPALIERMRPRLTDRTRAAEMELVVEIEASAQEAIVDTDPGAVEQIAFNLIDNSCKYAGDAPDRRIELIASVDARRLMLIFRDHGPGLAKSEARRRRQPFSKSAQEAAEAAPGVGLGLALCRRLARALRGKLIICAPEAGSLIRLELPLSPR
jgi:signal transduction histidine kinase